MSQHEVDQLEIIQRVIAKQLRQVEAAQLLGLSTRQVRNLTRQYQREGAKGLVSTRRGKPSNNRLSDEVKQQVLELIKAHYSDFGPTFAHEKLVECHGLKLGVESVRQLMMKAELWRGKTRKPFRAHPMRARRSRFGEMIQMDGSPHDWFEERGPRCCLHVLIDDATSALVFAYFAEVESTVAYFTAFKGYVKKYGRPLSVYVDRHSIFRITLKEAETGTGETQFGRAMRELGIELICAHSPQAKGRVEKANRTLQDRLIKEMRLKGLSTLEEGNAFLPEFIEDYNQRFAVAPAEPDDAHRKTLPDKQTFQRIFTHQETRKISKNLEVSYKNILYQIIQEKPCYTMRGALVQVCEHAGQIELIYKGKTLPYKIFDKKNQPAPIVDNKELFVRPPGGARKPKPTHPWRNPACVKPPTPQTLPAHLPAP